MEGIGEHVHWYVTGACNLNTCLYCFDPYNIPNETGSMEYLASILVDNGVRKVTITGGEPLLVKDLDKVLGILNKGGAYVSLHTNGLLLDERRIAGLSGLADDIAIPLDSTNRETQRKLRGYRFVPTFDRLAELAASIQENGMDLGYHTVFTALNRHDMPDIYKFVKETGFEYWRIYEFNDALVFSKLISLREGEKARKRIRYLQGRSSARKGHTDCLYAHFLLTEKEMKKHKDKRMQFVGSNDTQVPYAFLDNSGDIRYYTSFSYDKRRHVGNIIREGFPAVMAKFKDISEQCPYYGDEDLWDEFQKRTMDAAPWERYYDGIDPQEIECMSPGYYKLFMDLVKLHTKRVYGIDIRSRDL